MLNVVDIASGYEVSRPLRTKKASEVADMFRDIYKKGPLRYPAELHIDNGGEFKSDVDKLMNEHKVIREARDDKISPQVYGLCRELQQDD